MKRNILFVAVLLISVAILVPTTVNARMDFLNSEDQTNCEDQAPVTISKEIYCFTDTEDEFFSSNPPYYMGEKYYWWINMTVTAGMDLSDYCVVVFDRLGAEFMIEGICVDTAKQPDLPGYPSEGDPPEPFDYAFDYSSGDPWPERHETVDVLNNTGGVVTTGHVGWLGVCFKGLFSSGDEDWFKVFWTGKSCKAHFIWVIGGMEEGESKVIYLVVSTDVNPGGKQEFTSPCTHYLNSGATVKVLRRRARGTCRRCCWVPFYSATTDPITIKVEDS